MATPAKRVVKKPSAADGAAKPAPKRGKGPKPLPGQAAARAGKAPRAKAARRGGDGARTARGGAALVIVESPTKAKTIGKYLGSGYDVKATVGHLRDLPTRELGVDVERGFEPKYVTIKGKTKTLSELKKAAKPASTI